MKQAFLIGGYAWPWDSQFGVYSTSYVLERQVAGTDPNDSDSDDDGLSDGDEMNTLGTIPTMLTPMMMV